MEKAPHNDAIRGSRSTASSKQRLIGDLIDRDRYTKNRQQLLFCNHTRQNYSYCLLMSCMVVLYRQRRRRRSEENAAVAHCAQRRRGRDVSMGTDATEVIITVTARRPRAIWIDPKTLSSSFFLISVFQSSSLSTTHPP